MISGQSLAQERKPEFPVLRKQQAECLANAADTYIKNGRASLPLHVGLCPKIPGPREMARLSTRNALMNPGFEAGPLVPEDDKDAVVVLTRPQLECVRDHYDDIADEFDYVMPAGQNLKLVELMFDLCP